VAPGSTFEMAPPPCGLFVLVMLPDVARCGAEQRRGAVTLWRAVSFLARCSRPRRRRQDSLPASMMCARWVSRSTTAFARRASEKTLVHSPNGRLVVTIRLARSLRSERTWKVRSAGRRRRARGSRARRAPTGRCGCICRRLVRARVLLKRSSSRRFRIGKRALMSRRRLPLGALMYLGFEQRRQVGNRCLLLVGGLGGHHAETCLDGRASRSRAPRSAPPAPRSSGRGSFVRSSSGLHELVIARDVSRWRAADPGQAPRPPWQVRRFARCGG
jgi:hypothetical protein